MQAERKIESIIMWLLIYIAEFIIALVPTTLVIAVLILLLQIDRGYFAVGGEWIAIDMIFYLAYEMVHNKVCDVIYGEE